MKRMLRINVMLLSLLLLAGGMINAQGIGRVTEPGQYCGFIPDLTVEQKAELTDLAVKHRAEMDALRMERQTSIDREVWYAAGEKMRALTNKHRVEIMNVLTPEQKQFFTPRSYGSVGPVGRGGRGAGFYGPAGRGGRGAGFNGPVGRMGGGRGWRR